MPTTAAGWTALAAVTAASAATYSAIETRSAEKEAASEAKKQRLKQEERQKKLDIQELEAGEYFGELTTQQMELQAQSSNIKTLADLIDKQRQPAAKTQQIVTTPATRQEPGFFDNINLQIEKLFGF